MLLLETGGKWWLKHVIAPMAVGGGVVPLVLAMTNQLTINQLTLNPSSVVAPLVRSASAAAQAASAQNQPANHAPAPPSTQQADGKPAAAPQQAVVLHPSQTPASAAPAQPSPNPAQTPPERVRETHRPTFYASDLYNERYHNTHIAVRRGALIGLHWAVEPGTVSGKLHLRSQRAGHTVIDMVVAPSGYRSVEVVAPAEWALVDVRPDGERFLADLDLTPRN